ncbi:hypothetical protein HAP47_0027995 [Bradyrhizobium sp. 41S5]|uniref:hypothetical protein n=1 Tax=Bradyrhizobium sp. 41S5 TaxID=1404443 RepID=UPI00156B16DE|nr:hypothetical protein [Bradyrhizobium sp. 41S5]UFX43049.1 hypothetical protein HAP47_0027995 [Bradyrhizobium sp. 41S5]
MTTRNLDQAHLKAAIDATIDHATRQQILDYLINAGTGCTSPDDGATIPVEVGAGISKPDPDANVLIETSAINSDVTLTVNGSPPVLVASGAGNDYVSFNNNGDSTVLTGAGNDLLRAGNCMAVAATTGSILSARAALPARWTAVPVQPPQQRHH